MSNLAALLADPRRVAELLPEEAAAALVEIAALQMALAARLHLLAAAPSPEGRESAEDRWLTVEQVAERLGLTVEQFYRRWRRFPFARKLGRRTLRFSEDGLRRYMASKRGSRKRDTAISWIHAEAEARREPRGHGGHHGGVA